MIMSTISEKSEILFLYETSYNIPNGDPFTGEQRYDEETKKILVSDVRIKRFVRTYFEEHGEKIYVSGNSGNQTAKSAIKRIAEEQDQTDIADVMKSLIDVRAFGGISTLEDSDLKITKNSKGEKCENGHVQITGPIQFSLLNPSLNKVNLRMHQNTSHFTSKEENKQGAIGTTTIVPYSVMQIHGWTNPSVAKISGLTNDDKKKVFEGMWYGTSGEGSSFSRSKIGQNSLLLLELVYSDNKKKLYGIDRLISIKTKEDKAEEQIRSIDDFEFDFTKLIEKANSDAVEKVRYHTDIEEIKTKLTACKELVKKLEEIKFEEKE